MTTGRINQVAIFPIQSTPATLQRTKLLKVCYTTTLQHTPNQKHELPQTNIPIKEQNRKNTYSHILWS